MSRLAAGLMLMAVAPAALAHPEGAPWGHAGAQEATCSACHQGPAGNEAALELRGLPGRVEAGEVYALELELLSPGRLNGFQLEAVASAGRDAGRIEPDPRDAGLEVEATRARSTGGGPVWRLHWKAGAACRPDFHVAAVAGNDDLSPFGDAVATLTLEGDCTPAP